MRGTNMDASAFDPESVSQSMLVTRPGRPGDRVTKVVRVDGDDSTCVLLAGTVRRETTLANEAVLVEGIDTVVEIGDEVDLDRLLQGFARVGAE